MDKTISPRSPLLLSVKKTKMNISYIFFLKSFNCLPPVLFLCLFLSLLLAICSLPVLLVSFLSLLLAMSIHWFVQFSSKVTNHAPPQCFFYTSSWLTEICIWDETRGLQIALPMTLTLLFFLYFRYSTQKIHSCQFWTSRSVILLITSCFFLLVLLWKEFNSHSFIVTFHLSFTRLTTCLFLSSSVWLLNSRKRQHATHRLFERWIPVGSSETAVCGFCLSLSLHFLIKITCFQFILLKSISAKIYFRNVLTVFF